MSNDYTDPLNLIRYGLEANLATIDGLNTHANEKGSPGVTPSAMIITPSIEYYGPGATFGAQGLVGDIDFPVLVNVGASIIDEATQQLSAYASWSGAQSIPQAVRVDKTLGGLVADTICVSFRQLTIEEFAGVGYWGGIFTVRIKPLRGGGVV